jgi:rhodanese-related sulfurtransferase
MRLRVVLDAHIRTPPHGATRGSMVSCAGRAFMRRNQEENIMATATLQKTDPARAKEYFQNKMAFTTGPVELERAMKAGEVNVVDVRAAEDYDKGHIPGAKNLPKNRWSTLEGLDHDKPNVLYCYSQVCHLAATAAVEFASRGFSIIELEGGFEGWKENDLPTEK